MTGPKQERVFLPDQYRDMQVMSGDLRVRYGGVSGGIRSRIQSQGALLSPKSGEIAAVPRRVGCLAGELITIITLESCYGSGK